MNKKNIRQSKEKGITLIALVITIIVMLTLVAVTISMAINGGLFEQAGKATGKTKNELNAEQNLANGGVEVNGEWYNSIDEYLETLKGQGNGGTQTPDPTPDPEPDPSLVAGATFKGYKYWDVEIDDEVVVEEIKFLTWEELKLEENGNKYGYNASAIDGSYPLDTAFTGCMNISNIIIPNSITAIAISAFSGCSSLESVYIPVEVNLFDTSSFTECESLTSITYGGTTAQWENIQKDEGWNASCPEITVTCTDGTITVPTYEY